MSWIEYVKWFVMGSMGEMEMVRPGGMGAIVFRDGTCEEVCHELGEVIAIVEWVKWFVMDCMDEKVSDGGIIIIVCHGDIMGVA